MTTKRNGDSRKTTAGSKSRARTGTKANAKKATAKKTTAKKSSTRKSTSKAAAPKKAATKKAAKKTGTASRSRRKTTTNAQAATPLMAKTDAQVDHPTTLADDAVVGTQGLAEALSFFDLDEQAGAVEAPVETAVALQDAPDVEEPTDIEAEADALLSSLLADVPDDGEPVSTAQHTATPRAEVSDAQSTGNTAPVTVHRPHFAELTFSQFVGPFLIGLGLGMLIGLAF